MGNVCDRKSASVEDDYLVTQQSDAIILNEADDLICEEMSFNETLFEENERIKRLMNVLNEVSEVTYNSADLRKLDRSATAWTLKSFLGMMEDDPTSDQTKIDYFIGWCKIDSDWVMVDSNPDLVMVDSPVPEVMVSIQLLESRADNPFTMAVISPITLDCHYPSEIVTLKTCVMNKLRKLASADGEVIMSEDEYLLLMS